MITNFHVTGFKALRDVSLTLTPIHVLIGPNNSGKTSLLEAIRAACLISWLETSDAHRAGFRYRRVRPLGAFSSDVLFELQFLGSPPLQYSLRVQLWENNSEEFGQIVDCFVTQGKEVHDFPVGEDSSQSSDLLRLQKHPLGIKVLEELAGVHIHRLVPADLKRACPLHFNARSSFQENGYGFPIFLDEMRDNRDAFQRLESRFQKYFPEVKYIELPVEPIGESQTNGQGLIPAGKGIRFQLTNGDKLRADDASDGMMLVLAFLALSNISQAKGYEQRILLIEEPENGIHPSLLKEVIGALREIADGENGLQVVMTTHSPHVLSEFKPEEVTVCRRREADGNVCVRRLSESKAVVEQLDFFTLGEIWTMDGDDALMEMATRELPEG